MPVPAPRSSHQPAHPIYKPARVTINQHKSFDRLDSPHLLTEFHHFPYNFVSHSSNSSSISRGGSNPPTYVPHGRLGGLSNSFFDVEATSSTKVPLPLSNERSCQLPPFIYGLTDSPSVSISKSAFAKANCPPVPAIYSPTHQSINPVFFSGVDSVSSYDRRTGRPNPQAHRINIGNDPQNVRHSWNNPLFLATTSSQDTSAQYVLGCNGPLDSTLVSLEGTPFENFVDQAVSDDAGRIPVDVQMPGDTSFETREQPAPVEPSLNPVALQAYRIKAESISEWIAAYVWHIIVGHVSHGPSLQTSDHLLLSSPVPHLSRSISSLLCSTLLQPSAIILAMWYISRLPISSISPGVDSVARMNELLFQQELFGHRYSQSFAGDKQAEHEVPFRLVLLGCMLANKWLDDHTFSNKTWHAISDVPLEKINKLELLALNLLGHDLSISSVAWDTWLVELRTWNHHPSFRPSPIERPSASDPRTVVRSFIDELLFASEQRNACHPTRGCPEPVFVGLTDRVGEKEYPTSFEDGLDSTDIDLDEDGPLREEYLPQRRLTHRRVASCSHATGSTNPMDPGRHRESYNSFVPYLPPPAKWSPEADPPIERERDKTKDRYIAVRASVNDTNQELSGHPSAQLLTLSIGQLFNHSTHLLNTAQWLIPPYQLQ